MVTSDFLLFLPANTLVTHKQTALVGEVGGTGLIVNTLDVCLKLQGRQSSAGTSTRGWGDIRNL